MSGPIYELTGYQWTMLILAIIAIVLGMIGIWRKMKKKVIIKIKENSINQKIGKVKGNGVQVGKIERIGDNHHHYYGVPKKKIGKKTKKLEFKYNLEEKMLSGEKKIRMVFHFKNNTNENILVEGYHNTTTLDEKVVKSTSPDENILHRFDKIIKPSKNWQKKEYEWVDPDYYGLGKTGEYTFKMVIRYIYNEKRYKLINYFDYSWISKEVKDKPNKKLSIKELDDVNLKSKKKTAKPKWKIFFNDMVEVEPGDHEYLDFDFNEGDYIRGTAFETEKYEFSCYVMNEFDYSNYRNDDEFDPIEGYIDVKSIAFDFKIPEDNTWYFVFDTYGKQYNREIEVKLKILKK